MKVCLLTLHDLVKLLRDGVVDVRVDGSGEEVMLIIKPREVVENVKFKKGGRKMYTITIPKEWKDNDLIVIKVPR